jgi:peroxiredoxin (alkyl hydroperoxide reductase subunit C)
MSTLVQRPAPGFSAPAVLADNSIQEDFSLEEFGGKYRLILFYPWDFSFVCPTELLALDERLEDFQERDCEVMAVSVDSQFAHLAWKKTPIDDGGIGEVRFPMVSDPTKEISRAYGVLADEAVALRGTFLVDREGIVRHALVNDLNLGRSIPELLRTLDAIRHIDETGDTCPANWDGSKSKGAPPAGVVKKVQTFDLG